MKYAVLQTGGKQYKVTEGAEIEVDKIEADAESSLKFEYISSAKYGVNGASSFDSVTKDK